MTSEIVARTALSIAATLMQKNASDKHRCFRIKNLLAEEVVWFSALWPAIGHWEGLAGVKLVAADSLNGLIPREFVAEDDRSITYYRNNNPSGLVYIETQVQSDEQGLQNIFTLRDSNFLDGSFDSAAASERTVADLIVQMAWSVSSGSSRGKAPSLLVSLVTEVFDSLHPAYVSMPVRRFAAFAENVCVAWIADGQAQDVTSGSKIVGNELWNLGLLPDRNWRSEQSDARSKRRLIHNARLSDLSSGSGDLDVEIVEAKLADFRFKNEAGTYYEGESQERFREISRRYLRRPSPGAARDLPMSVFEQLFAADVTGQKLGDRVRSDIASRQADRIPEFDELDIVQGLNTRNVNEAERFLSADPAVSGEARLSDLLSVATRKMLDRLMAPKSRRFSNPFTEISRFYGQASLGGRTPATVRIELSASADTSSPSLGLFAFLFGPSLRSVAGRCGDLPGGSQLEVADALVVKRNPPPVLDAENGSEISEDDTVVWSSLPLKFTALDDLGVVLDIADQVSWDPDGIQKLALLWLLIAESRSALWTGLGALSIVGDGDRAEWLAPIVNRVVPIEQVGRLVEYELDDLGACLVECRASFAERSASHGLSVDVIRDFIDQWSVLLSEARARYVPNGRRIQPMDALLTTDFLVVGDDQRRIMLATHPARLRWIGSYLGKCIDVCVDLLTGQSAASEALAYLQWLDERTPHESPSVATDESGRLLFAKSEDAWTEEFSPVETGVPEISSDRFATASLANEVSRYLDAHPYKCSGLSVLVVLPASDGFPSDLVREIARGKWKGVRVSMTVAVPRHRWEAIARSFEAMSSSTSVDDKRGLFPSFDLSFVDFTRGADMASAVADELFDLVVVTHILQDSVQVQHHTESTVARTGGYDPILDRPVVLDKQGDGGAISVVMRPRDPDSILEDWSTLVVRATRTRPVAPEQPENLDFIESRVNFEDSARLFSALHASCHWVMTLERHISREQIESVEAGAPDVLSIQGEVGNNGLSTLIVSSSSGRDLIKSRIAGKLKRLVAHDDEVRQMPRLGRLAERIYDETRRIAPHLALRAMGISRVTEEILGVYVARSLADDRYGRDFDFGISVWLSLDEYADWFGGLGAVRPDMCRITLSRDESGNVSVDVLVLEGKLRQQFDEHGVTQVRAGVEFFQDALAPQSGASADAVKSLWRERFLSAIESTAREAREVRPPSVASALGHRVIPSELRAAVRSGAFHRTSVSGLYVATLWDDASSSVSVENSDEVTVLRVPGNYVFETLNVDRANTHQTGKPNSSFVEPAIPSAVLPAWITASAPDVIVDGSHSAPTTLSSGAQLAKAGRMPEADLLGMYGEILAAFAEHGVQVTRVVAPEIPYIEGPASILFRVNPGHGVDPRKLQEKAAALKLALKLAEEQSVGFGIDAGYVTLDVPKSLSQRYFVAAEDVWRRWNRPADALAAPIGEDRYGKDVIVNFSSANSPHLLVGGTTGSGKSEALNTILYGLIRHYGPEELRLLLVDPKGTELVAFENDPHLLGAIGWDDADALSMLTSAVDEMQRRYLLFKAQGTRSLVDYNNKVLPAERLPWWLIVLDEYADLTSDPQSKKDIEAELRRLAQKARASGIHLIIATQKPSADVISTNLRANLPAQLGLRVKSATESRVLIDEGGAEILNGKGDALFKADGRTVRVQCARVSENA